MTCCIHNYNNFDFLTFLCDRVKLNGSISLHAYIPIHLYPVSLLPLFFTWEIHTVNPVVCPQLLKEIIYINNIKNAIKLKVGNNKNCSLKRKRGGGDVCLHICTPSIIIGEEY